MFETVSHIDCFQLRVVASEASVCVCVCVLSHHVLMNAPDTTPSKYSAKLFIVVLFVLPKETRLDFKNRGSEKLRLHLQQRWKEFYDPFL